MSRSLGSSGDTGTSQALGTTSARLVAVKLKSANKNIFRALMSLASANLLIRVMGLLNQVIVTYRFGEGAQMDAYVVASTLPTLLAQLLASALESSVIPVYSRIRTRGTKEQASRLFSTLLNLLIVNSILLTILMFILRQPLLLISAPGSAQKTLDLTVGLAPLVFPVIIFMILNSFMECLLNAEGKFGWPAYAGMLVPLSTAAFVLLAGKNDGVAALAIGTLAGQLLQLAVIVYRAYLSKIKYKPVVDLSSPEMKMIGVAAAPAIFGGLISLASPLTDQIFTSLVHGSGNISALNYAQKLNGVPTGVIFAAVGRAALPYLAAQAAIKDMKAFKNTLRLYVWAVAIATLIASLVMGVGATIIVKLLFQHKGGSFTAENVALTSSVLIGLVIGMMPTAIGYILSRAFSALGKTRVLMWVSITSIFLNAAFDYVFGHIWGVFGIAFATSIYYFITMMILIVGLRATIGPLNLLTPPKELLDLLWKFRLGQLYLKWVDWRDEYFTFAGAGVNVLKKKVMRVSFAVLVFAGGVAGAIANGTMTLRIAFGATIVLIFLRYQYILLLAWATINVFIGTNLPFFNGGNLLSGLTLPSLLLLFYLPTRLALKRMIALRFMLAFIIWILFSVGFSPITPYAFFVSWTSLLDYIAVAVLVILIIDSRQKLLFVIDAISLPAIFIAAYGIWGYAHKMNGVIDTSTGYFRISSIFGNTPPTLAMYLSIIIPMYLYRIFNSRGWMLMLRLGILVLYLGALALTFDRGSEISLPLGAMIILFFLPTRKQRGILVSAFVSIGAAILVVALALHIAILSRFTNTDLTSLNGRTYLWQAIIDHFDPTQLLGYGHQASDQLLANLKVGFGGGVIATVAHNIYLETMYDHGLIGVGILIMTLTALGLTLIHLWLQSKTSADRRLLIAMALWTFTAIVFQSAESNDIWNQSVGIYFFIFMALPFALYWDKVRPDGEVIAEPVEQAASEGAAQPPNLAQPEFAHV